MAVLLDPFDTLLSFQQALDAYRTSSWLDAGLSGGGAYPPLNVFRKGDDFIIIAELAGVKKSDWPAKERSAIRRRRRCIAASVLPAGSTGR